VGRTIVATLEDEIRATKIACLTAIPKGTYKLELRNEGKMTRRYAKRFPDVHKGMIWLRNVPGYTFVYIHIGNFVEDTDGCILVGERARSRSLQSSTSAYLKIYPKIVKMIEEEGCQIVIRDDFNSEEGDRHG
jgi:hypothetical protein